MAKLSSPSGKCDLSLRTLMRSSSNSKLSASTTSPFREILKSSLSPPEVVLILPNQNMMVAVADTMRPSLPYRTPPRNSLKSWSNMNTCDVVVDFTTKVTTFNLNTYTLHTSRIAPTWLRFWVLMRFSTVSTDMSLESKTSSCGKLPLWPHSSRMLRS